VILGSLPLSRLAAAASVVLLPKIESNDTNEKIMMMI
jgi:hypothetical protein